MEGIKNRDLIYKLKIKDKLMCLITTEMKTVLFILLTAYLFLVTIGIAATVYHEVKWWRSNNVPPKNKMGDARKL